MQPRDVSTIAQHDSVVASNSTWLMLCHFDQTQCVEKSKNVQFMQPRDVSTLLNMTAWLLVIPVGLYYVILSEAEESKNVQLML